MLSMHGTLNEEFDAKKMADSVKTKNVVIAMADVRRVASFGMAEWMEFLRRLADRDVYIVECSTYAVSQLNLVSGLLGQSKLVSFYSAYRCSGCNTESNSLFLVPRDRGIIRELPGSEYECRNCGGAARLEEYPAAFFDTIANRDPFEIDDDVLAFFRTQLKYDLAPDLARFRAVGAQLEDISYMRLSGQLARLPSDKLTHAARARTIMDLEGVVFDDSGVPAWGACMDAVLPKVTSLQLHGCPPGFLEAAVPVADLRDRVKVRSFVHAYECVRCDAMRPREIDVAANLEDLVMGKLPDSTCPTCKSTLLGMPSAELVALLKALPARDRDPVLEKFFAKSRAEPATKLENLLVFTAKKPQAPASGGRGGLYAVLGLIVVVLGAVGWFAIDAWRNQKQAENRVVSLPVSQIDAAPAKPTFVRPEWITEDTPSSSYCQDMINRIMCVGVSSYRTNRDEAVAEANDAALDELVNTVALKISDPLFKETLAPAYGTARNAQLGAVHAAEAERTGEAYKAAQKAATNSRRIVAEALRATGSAAVPAQRSDWHWEEYAADGGGPNEQLVFVRYDVALDAVRSLVEHYSIPVTALGGATLVTAFPGRGWENPDLASGAVVVKPGRLARAGVKAESVIVGVDDQPVADALQLSRALEAADKAHTELHLKVATPGAPPTTLSVKL
ncbi:hypothetical protein BH11MYX2_BH11MYX2_03090 [soil metagenome]